MSFFNNLLNLLFPPKCVFCKAVLERDELSGGVCRKCRRALPWTDGAVGEVAAPLWYRGDVRGAVHRFKFRGAINYAAPLGGIIADEIKRTLEGQYDLISWVPISAVRHKKRGYDQSMLLASSVALALGEVAAETLVKIRDNPAQSSQKDRCDRLKNVKGAYQVTVPELVEGKRILLIDDVYTTGATMNECADVLRAAGAAEVLFAVLARAGE